MLLYFLLMPISYIIFKIVKSILVKRFGKFSYDGISIMGFAYDSKKDAFYSTKNAWQKNFGYCHLYDVLAPEFRMIVDTEPIRFNYNNKNWLITFWKGQYGIVTGAEIGVYNTQEVKVNKKTLYFPVQEDEMLDMSFILYKNGNEITRISAKHWWLAIFKLGMFSKPKELTMDIKITFPCKEMMEVFFKSFKKKHHKSKYYNIVDNTFYFSFKKAKTPKVWTRYLLSTRINQYLNKKNVSLYNMYIADLIDYGETNNKKIFMLKKLIPNFLTDVPKKEILKNNLKQNNVIFLHDSVFPGLGDKDE
ncbi:MAG: DUF4474 domain-containing protein [Bacilli bacterium]